MKYLTLIVTTITPVLYVIGLSFYQSYLRHFGLEETQFPLSVDRTIFQGFATSFNLSVDSIYSIYGVAIGVFFLVGVVDIAFQKVPFLQKLLSKFEPQNSETKLYTISEKAILHLPAIGVLAIGLILIIAKTVSVGVNLAGDFVERCDNGDISTQQVALQDNTELAACQIICNSDQCAYYTNTNAYIVNRDGRVYAAIPLNQ